MNGPHEVSINNLLKICKKMHNAFFPSTDVYSLLVLSLVTVTAYSRKIHHLNAHTRIELSIAILSDLIDFLLKESVISEKDSIYLTKQCQDKHEDIPIILRSYMYVADGLHMNTKNDKHRSMSHHTISCPVI